MQNDNVDKEKLREKLIKLTIFKPVHIILYQMQIMYTLLSKKITKEKIEGLCESGIYKNKELVDYLFTLRKEFGLCYKLLLFFAYYAKTQNLYMRYNILTTDEIRSEVMLEGKTWIDIYNELHNNGYLERIRQLGPGDIYEKSSLEEKMMVNEYVEIYSKLVQPGKEDDYNKGLN